ncbi:MAG: ATP-binding protein [Frankiales bacterium]|nr:ATP-binding protein [Frankiales bacterium]
MTVTDVCEELTGTWPASPTSVGSVRQQARCWLRELGLDELEDACLLVVSELATNAVVHAGTGFRICLTRLCDGLLLLVNDGSTDLPGPGVAPQDGAVSGRGMFLVETLCEGWGVVRDGEGGKATWALLADPVPGALPRW